MYCIRLGVQYKDFLSWGSKSRLTALLGRWKSKEIKDREVFMNQDD